MRFSLHQKPVKMETMLENLIVFSFLIYHRLDFYNGAHGTHPIHVVTQQQCVPLNIFDVKQVCVIV